MRGIAAYETPFDISADISLFDQTHRILRRKFYLRNLAGETLEAQLGQANEVLTEFAKEIQYITGSGVDKISIHSGRNKVSEIVIGLEPHPSHKWFYYAIKLAFEPTCGYVWQNDQGLTRFSIEESEMADGWETTIHRLRKAASFTLPCIFRSDGRGQEAEGDLFLTFGQNIKRRRKTVGWYARYDAQDPVFNRFQARFVEHGQLAVGDLRCFTLEGKPMRMVGAYVPARKQKPTKVPRKTYLASQPTDATDYVYIIRMGRKNVFKIGKTNDPQGRLFNLQTASPFKLSMFNVFCADNASAAEESLHAAFRDCRLEGEWFSLSDAQKSVIAQIKSFEDGKFITGADALTAKALLRAN